MPHAVSRLRAERLARSTRPFFARGAHSVRCPECRIPVTGCMCALRPAVSTRAGMCLLMQDIEPLKPTNTGWLVGDVVTDTAAFTWTRTHPDPRLLALLSDPQWQPYVVFPAGDIAPERFVQTVVTSPNRRPLFVLLDATWSDASRMFRKSPYLDAFPVIAFPAGVRPSRYRLRRTHNDAQLCTAEVAALCLRLAGEEKAASALDAWLDVFIAHTLTARGRAPADVRVTPA